MSKKIVHIVVMLLLGSVTLFSCASQPSKSDFDASARAAKDVLSRFEADPGMETLRGKLTNAKAIMIVSQGVGRCVALARIGSARGWSAPAFYRVSRLEAAGRIGGSGLTASKPDLDLIVLAMTDKALNWLKSPKVPGQGGLVAMPVTPGSSDRELSKADMLVFSSGKAAHALNLFIDIFVSVDKAANQSYYGKPLPPAEILTMESATDPEAASLQQAVAAAAR